MSGALWSEASRLVGLAAWLGLLAGYAELAAMFLLRNPTGNILVLVGKSRHYTWLIPLIDAAFLAGFALILAVAALVTRRSVSKLGQWGLGTLVLLPALLVAAPGIYAIALLLLSLGLASWLVPLARSRTRLIIWSMRITLPAMLLGLVVLAGFSSLRGRWPSPWGARDEAHGSPNVLLIVLDTVRADHLSLHGYDRPTTPHLEAQGKRGVVFRQAHAAAPWTFPSHASLFTGRWPHEVLAGHDVPLDALPPTLAEVLASRGYDTVGVVGNLGFCSYYTGLDRGFRTYSDIPLTFLGALATTELGDHLLGALDDLITLANPAVHHPSLKSFRKDADRVNREFLDWLDHGRHPGRPFFAFLNYFDAHDPYIVPPGGDHRFGHRPRTELERRLLETWWFWPKKLEITPEQYEALRDGYDSCLAYLDDRLGRLLGELERRGELRETLVLITSDHGEAFGEHGLFSHGGSLYQDQLHVPLLIVGPDPLVPAGRTIDALISTRDLAATVVDLLHLDSGPAPLPGRSLARFWNDNDSPTPADSGLLALATVEDGGTFLPNGSLSPVFNGRMIGLINDHLFKYILIIDSRQSYEEIYAIDVDPAEQTDLAGMESMQPTLRTFRQQAAAILLGKDTNLVHADRSHDRPSPVQAGPVVR